MRFPDHRTAEYDWRLIALGTGWLLLLLTILSAGAALGLDLGSVPNLRLTGDQDHDNFGSAVSSAGDVNGDGYLDVIVGAYNYDSGEQDEGKAFLYLGTAAGLSTTPAWTGESDQMKANYGYSVAVAGDVNGDGYDDVVIGARFYSYSAGGGGRAYLYQGGPNGLTAGPCWVVDGDREMELLGTSVASAGDVNGDGYDDVLVGAELFTESKTNQGRALLYLGSPRGLSTTPAWWFDGDEPGASVGWSVSSAGDVNGDGYGDVLVGAPGYSVLDTSVGAAMLFLGAQNGLSPTPVWVTTGGKKDDYYGYCVASAGDVNGDGYCDLLVGAPDFDGEGGDQGKVDVFLGAPGGPSATPFCSLANGTAGAWFGYSTQTAGDVNGDGYADILVGSPMARNWLGEVHLYLGSASGPMIDEPWIVGGSQPWEVLGESVGGAGDINGDGFGDLLLAAGYYDGSQPDGGEVLVFHGSASGPSTTPGWSATIPHSGAGYGRAVSPAGDLNGDGRSDVVVGSPSATGHFPSEGAAFVYLGSATGLGNEAGWTGEGGQTGCGYGSAVSCAGDLNGDGWDDLLVGAPAFDHQFLDEGRAFLYFGSPSGVSATPSWTADGEQEAAALGSAVAGMGDVNGDGYGDILLGAPKAGGAFQSSGRAALYLGSPQGLSPISTWTAGGGCDSALFGASLAMAGDVNRDGFSDVIVGAPGFTHGQIREGEALVYLGSPSGLAASPAWVVEGGQAGAEFGFAVASAGDVNGDGYDDVIVGAPLYSDGQTEEGAAFVYLGSEAGLSTTPGWSIEGNRPSAHLGNAVSSAGDPMGQGLSAVAVGAPGWDASLPGQGRALVFPGSSAGPAVAPMAKLTGDQAGAALGASVCLAGDVTGDGVADLLVGAPGYDAPLLNQGEAFLFQGNERQPLNPGRSWLPRQTGVSGKTISLRGESDDTGAFRLWARGICPAGRAKVRLEWDAAPLSAPLSSVVRGAGPWQDTGFPVAGAGSSVALEGTVQGCTPGAPYHWRLRIASRNPRFPRSPWFTLPGCVPSEVQLRLKPELLSGIGEGSEDAVRPDLGLACPNPFRPGMELYFSVSTSSPVKLTIHDSGGRLVATLANGPMERGRHTVRWDGVDRSGRPVPAGVYFTRCRTGSRTSVGRFTFLPG